MGNSHRRKKKRKNKSTRPKQEPGPRPRLFCDFGRIANDLLRKGYNQDQILSISTHSCNGVMVPCTLHHLQTLTSRAVKHGRQSTMQLGARYKYKNAAIDVNMDTKSSISTTLTLGGEFLPSTHVKASVRFPDCNSSKLNLKFQHFFRNATLLFSVGLNRSPDVMLSATIGTSSIAFGMESKYKTASRSFTQYDAGISVTKPTCDASIILAEKCDLLRLAYAHHFGHSRKISAVAEVTRRLSKNKNSLAVGVSCILDNLTTVKAKLNNQGKLQALLIHKIKPNSCLNISGEVDMKALDKIPRIGLALALML
ncbi:hypothetical protein PTKIN_Ptkin10aG0121800 [Pterospermum kingtungense]